MKRKGFCVLLILLALLLAACQSAQLSDVREAQDEPTELPSDTPVPNPVLDPQASMEERIAFYRKAAKDETLTVVFSQEAGFYDQDISLTLTAEGASDIFYTDDGSEPGPSSTRYTRPIALGATDARLPRCAVIRAAAYYPDGTKSPVFTSTYFLNTKIQKRFSVPILSIVAPPEELTSGPDALLVGKRALETGASAQRTVRLEVFLSDGTKALSQDATLRVYGDASREMPVKSFELIAGTGREAEPQSFGYAFFGTSNAQGELLHYQRLVLSGGEDDFQYAFIRDELAQTLAELGHTLDYEEVQPAVVYLNGEYYGLHWLHEVYSDSFFQAINGASDGRYAVIDWSREQGAVPLERVDYAAAEAFQSNYEQMLRLNLREEESFARLQRFLDVENYLSYCALNIFIDNPDWPGHMRLYAYIPQDGDAGNAQWRFLPHDMDRSFGLKAGQNAAQKDTLAEVLNADSSRYATLLAKLLQREDCREYFVKAMAELAEDKLGRSGLLSVLQDLHNTRNAEMQYYFSRLDALAKVRNSGVWMKKSDFNSAYSELTSYVKARPAAVQTMLENRFPALYP